VAVRVRLKINCIKTKKSLYGSVLVNSGFETEKPELLIPLRLAEKLGLWPDLPRNAKTSIYGSAGGPMRVFIVPSALRVKIIAKGAKSQDVLSDAVISDIEEEALIGDKLGGKLGIVILNLWEGLWKLENDPVGKIRRTSRPQYW
jgi:hypothetical protein